jgi:hypothetical protein
MLKPQNTPTSAKKTLIVYHFYHKNEYYVENFQHFILFGYTKENDYYILISGTTDILLPQAENIKYLSVKNINNDYGGYCQLFSQVTDFSQYDYFVFINSSVRGPFLIPGSTESWVAKYTGQLNARVGLVGGTICILHPNHGHAAAYLKKWGGHSATHIQTMSYAMSRATLAYLIESGFYKEQDTLSKYDVIEDYEIRLSQLILQKGLDLKCLLPEYNQVSYLDTHHDINPLSEFGDPCPRSAYFGRTLSPFEAVFVKTNRGIYSHAYLKQLAYSALQNIQKRQDLLVGDQALLDYVKKISNAHQYAAKGVLPEEHLYKRKNAHIALIRAHRHLKAMYKELNKDERYKGELLHSYLNSNSWKITAPLRFIIKKIRWFFRFIIA